MDSQLEHVYILYTTLWQTVADANIINRKSAMYSTYDDIMYFLLNGYRNIINMQNLDV